MKKKKKRPIPKKLKKALDEVPEGLPFVLNCLTAAGHLHSHGFAVEEEALHKEGLSGCAFIFAPIPIIEEDTGYEGHINMMYEVRANMLVSLQEAANECGVSYRTIQRWRDEKKIPIVTIKGKQHVPIEIAKDYASRQGHIQGRIRWR